MWGFRGWGDERGVFEVFQGKGLVVVAVMVVGAGEGEGLRGTEGRGREVCGEVGYLFGW